jgi:osmotically-inducible protein OsmY
MRIELKELVIMRDDETIKKRVVDQLYWDNRIDSSNVKVEVSDAVVTLSGTLPTLFLSMLAVEDAEDVAGVRHVKNYLKVKMPETLEVPTDEEIKMVVESMLRWNPNIVSTDIDISVVMGQVILEGSVPTYWEKMKAEKMALEAAGAIMVTNKLSVVTSGKSTDKKIAEDIVAALDRHAYFDVEWVDVKVEDGHVTLSGTVPDYRAYRTAYNVSAYTCGVLDIIDDLKLGVLPETTF